MARGLVRPGVIPPYYVALSESTCQLRVIVYVRKSRVKMGL